jgi:RNA polymerase sigma factor (sigma-70 family)
LRQLLRRRIAKLFRRYRRTHKRRIALERPCQAASSSTGSFQLAANAPTPSALVMEAEQTQALRRVVNRLPEEYQQVIRLRYEEERPFEEIGMLMQRTANGARLLWLRAIDRLQHELKVSDGR